MESFVEACKQFAVAVPRPVHWAMLICNCAIGGLLLVRVEQLVKQYADRGQATDRTRALRYIFTLFGWSLAGAVHAWLLHGFVFPDGVPFMRHGHDAGKVPPLLFAIASLFYFVKVLRRSPP